MILITCCKRHIPQCAHVWARHYIREHMWGIKELQLLFFVVFKGGGGKWDARGVGVSKQTSPSPQLQTRRQGGCQQSVLHVFICLLSPFSPISFTNTGHFFAKQKASCDFPAKHSSSMVEDQKKKKKKEVAKYFFIWCLDSHLIGCCFMWVI